MKRSELVFSAITVPLDYLAIVLNSAYGWPGRQKTSALSGDFLIDFSPGFWYNHHH